MFEIQNHEHLPMIFHQKMHFSDFREDVRGKCRLILNTCGALKFKIEHLPMFFKHLRRAEIQDRTLADD